jgi:hypothetical protein
MELSLPSIEIYVLQTPFLIQTRIDIFCFIEIYLFEENVSINGTASTLLNRFSSVTAIIDRYGPSSFKLIKLSCEIVTEDRLCGLVVRVPEVRLRFSALPDFLRSSGSGTGSTQPCEYN